MCLVAADAVDGAGVPASEGEEQRASVCARVNLCSDGAVLVPVLVAESVIVSCSVVFCPPSGVHIGAVVVSGLAF